MRITLYDFGKIIVDGETHTRDIIILPGGVKGPWSRDEGHRLAINDLADVWDMAPETLVVGTGYHGYMTIPEETADFARSKGIEILAAKTPEAVAQFNKLESDPGRRVAAALHLTC